MYCLMCIDCGKELKNRHAIRCKECNRIHENRRARERYKKSKEKKS